MVFRKLRENISLTFKEKVLSTESYNALERFFRKVPRSYK